MGETPLHHTLNQISPSMHRTQRKETMQERSKELRVQGNLGCQVDARLLESPGMEGSPKPGTGTRAPKALPTPIHLSPAPSRWLAEGR